MEVLFLLGFCLAVVYVYAFISGFTDAANAIATSVATKALSPKLAVLMAGILELAGALSGTAVALMIGKGIVDPTLINLTTVAGALVGAMCWSLFTYTRGIPVSETHGLIGGVLGAAIATTSDFDAIRWTGLQKILIAIVASPILGFTFSFVLTKGIHFLFRNFPASIMNTSFLNLQRLSAAFMAFSHGRNDAQKPMGIVVLILAIYFGWNIKELTVPLWVILSIGVTAGFGVACGGWRIMRTLGMKLTDLRTEQGFAAETSGAAVLQIASGINISMPGLQLKDGIPVSTTHIITSSIAGAGAARRFSSIRWVLLHEILVSWVFTLPATVLLGACWTLLFSLNPLVGIGTAILCALILGVVALKVRRKKVEN